MSKNNNNTNSKHQVRNALDIKNETATVLENMDFESKNGAFAGEGLDDVGGGSPDLKRAKLEQNLGEIRDEAYGIVRQPQKQATVTADAYEDINPKSGICRILLFGKTMAGGSRNNPLFHNCCVVVQGMQRNAFLLLKEQGMDTETHKTVAEKAFQDFKQRSLTKAFKGKNNMGMATLNFKPVKRHYVFEKQIEHPHGELQWCKVTYDGNTNGPVSTESGTDYSAVFGTTTPLFELLVRKRSIKGPMWLRIKDATIGRERITHCYHEVHIKNHKCLMSSADFSRKKMSDIVLPQGSPPLKIMVLGTKTRQKNKGGEHELGLISMAILTPPFNVDQPQDIKSLQEKFQRWGVIRKFDPNQKPPQNVPLKKSDELKIAENEGHMLREFVKKFHEIDPDIIVQHNAYAFGLDVLQSRLSVNRILGWDRLSRLKRTGEISYRKGNANNFYGGRNLTLGRLVCDTLLGAKESMMKMTNFEIPSIAMKLFNLQIPEGPDLDFSSNEKMNYFLAYYYDEMILTFNIMHRLELLTLTKQLTCIGGNLWSHSLQNKRAERNEFLLLHEFHHEKYVTPDKIEGGNRRRFNDDLAEMEQDVLMLDEAQLGGGDGGGDAVNGGAGGGASGTKSKGPAYSGGLVLEPKVKLYDEYVLLLDFNSLYPSLIQEYNICFSTVDRPRGGMVQKLSEQDMMSRVIPPASKDDRNWGILPRVIRRLVESRKAVKKQIKECHQNDDMKKQALEIKQKAIKLTANSMYGCLGFQNSRFYAKPIAALITQRGRAALSDTQQLIEGMNFEVVYGDTDSVFVRSFTKDYNAAMQIAKQISNEVNKKYKRLEIDLDGVFERILLLKKKKYAGLKIIQMQPKKITEEEYKGLDLVRRDWCKLSSRMGKEVLTQILCGQFEDDGLVNWIHDYLRTKKQEMDDLKIGKEEFVITKALSKLPHQYPDKRSQPHVMAAQRLVDAGKQVFVGTEVAYVICRPKADSDDTKCAIKPEDRNTVGMCAFPPEDLEKKGEEYQIELDVDWYIKSQLHPPLSRLLIPIEGTDNSQIAECLGMDASKFNTNSGGGGGHGGMDFDDDFVTSSALIDEILNPIEKFKGEKLLFEIDCPSCGTNSTLAKLLALNENLNVTNPALCLSCPRCNYFDPKRLVHRVQHAIRMIINQYWDGTTKCTEGTCNRFSHTLSLNSLGNRCENPMCNAPVKEIFSQRDVQDQLNLCGIMLSRAREDIEIGYKKSGGTDGSNDPQVMKMGQVLSGLKRSSKMLEILVLRSAYNTLNMQKLWGNIWSRNSGPGSGNLTFNQIY